MLTLLAILQRLGMNFLRLLLDSFVFFQNLALALDVMILFFRLSLVLLLALFAISFNFPARNGG